MARKKLTPIQREYSRKLSQKRQSLKRHYVKAGYMPEIALEKAKQLIPQVSRPTRQSIQKLQRTKPLEYLGKRQQKKLAEEKAEWKREPKAFRRGELELARRKDRERRSRENERHKGRSRNWEKRYWDDNVINFAANQINIFLENLNHFPSVAKPFFEEKINGMIESLANSILIEGENELFGEERARNLVGEAIARNIYANGDIDYKMAYDEVALEQYAGAMATMLEDISMDFWRTANANYREEMADIMDEVSGGFTTYD